MRKKNPQCFLPQLLQSLLPRRMYLNNSPSLSPVKRAPGSLPLDGEVTLELALRRDDKLLEQPPLHLRLARQVDADEGVLEVPVGVVAADGHDLAVRAAREEDVRVLELGAAELAEQGARGGGGSDATTAALGCRCVVEGGGSGGGGGRRDAGSRLAGRSAVDRAGGDGREAEAVAANGELVSEERGETADGDGFRDDERIDGHGPAGREGAVARGVEDDEVEGERFGAAATVAAALALGGDGLEELARGNEAAVRLGAAVGDEDIHDIFVVVACWWFGAIWR